MVYLKYIRKNNIIEYSDGETNHYHIKYDGIGYYATLSKRPFEKLDIDKLYIQKKVLGYSDEQGGYFPYCKSEKDVIKLLRGLQKESKIRYYAATEI